MSRATYTKQHCEDFAELIARCYNRVERAQLVGYSNPHEVAEMAVNICREEIEEMFSRSNARFDADKWNLWIAGFRTPGVVQS